MFVRVMDCADCDDDNSDSGGSDCRAEWKKNTEEIKRLNMNVCVGASTHYYIFGHRLMYWYIAFFPYSSSSIVSATQCKHALQTRYIIKILRIFRTQFAFVNRICLCAFVCFTCSLFGIGPNGRDWWVISMEKTLSHFYVAHTCLLRNEKHLRRHLRCVIIRSDSYQRAIENDN